MTTTRRDFPASVAATAGAAITPDLKHEHSHELDHEPQAVPSDPALRVKALESLLVEKAQAFALAVKLSEQGTFTWIPQRCGPEKRRGPMRTGTHPTESPWSWVR
jgi:hypothetical protein